MEIPPLRYPQRRGYVQNFWFTNPHGVDWRWRVSGEWHLGIHIVPTVIAVTRRKMGTCEHVSEFDIGVTAGRTRSRTSRPAGGRRRDSSGFGGETPSSCKGTDLEEPGDRPGSGREGQSRCLLHPDLAPRGAVRRTGPRLGSTRSAHGVAPGEMAIFTGNHGVKRPPGFEPGGRFAFPYGPARSPEGVTGYTP